MLDRYHSEKTGTNYENQSATVFIIPNHGSEVLNRRDQRVFFFSSKWLGIFYRSRQRKKKPSGTQGIGGAALINFFVPDAALIRVNTVFGYSYDIGQKRQEVDCLQGEV